VPKRFPVSKPPDRRLGWPGDDLLTALSEPMLRVRAALWAEYSRMHALVVRIVGQDMHQKAADELPGIEGHQLLLVMMAVVLPVEADAAVGPADEAAVGPRDRRRRGGGIRPPSPALRA